MKDCYGQALKDFCAGNKRAKLKVESDMAETEYWPVSMYFRSEKDMNCIEKRALELCRGRVLDVGAGAGCHSLLLQEKGLYVDAIDISEGAVEVMQTRGVKNAMLQDFYKFEGRKYDTILMLMNGLGIAGTIDNMPRFLQKVKELLAEGGQLVCDSANVIRLFTDEEGWVMIDLNGKYYGEFVYTMTYKRQKSDPFDWLFLDYEALLEVCDEQGYVAEKIVENVWDEYLVTIRPE